MSTDDTRLEAFGGERRNLLILILLAIGVRLPGLTQDLWFDEIWMLVEFVRRPLSELVTSYPADNHHPLYTLMAWCTARVFGEAAWSLRLPAFVFGVACVPAVVCLGRRVVGNGPALMAGLFLAVSPHHVAFSQNARAYTVLLFLSIVATHAYLGCVRHGSRRATLVLAVSLGLASYAHLTAVFVGAGLVSGLVLETLGSKRRAALVPAWRGLGLAVVLAVALHLPLMSDLVAFFLPEDAAPKPDAVWRSPLWTVQETARSLGFGLLPGLVAMGLGAAVLVVGALRVLRTERAAFLAFVLPPLLGGLLLVALGRNLWPRFFFFASGGGVIVLVAGLQTLFARTKLVRERSHAQACAALIVFASPLVLWRIWTLPKQDFAGAAAWVDEHLGPDDDALTVGLASYPYEVYVQRPYVPVETPDELESASAGRRVLILSTFPIYLRSRHPQLAAVLEERAEEVARFPGSVGDGDVVVYELR